MQSGTGAGQFVSIYVTGRAPWNAAGTMQTPILVQAGLATIFLLLSVLGKGTTVEKAYLILLDTQLLVYFIPYVYLFISFLIHRRTEAPAGTVRVPGGPAGAWAVGLSG